MATTHNEPGDEIVARLRKENDEQLRAMDARIQDLTAMLAGRQLDGVAEYLENLQYLKPPPLGRSLPEQVVVALQNLQYSLARPSWSDVNQLPVQLRDLGFLHQAKPLSDHDDHVN